MWGRDFPGVNLSLEALHMAAAALPHIDVTKPQKVIGTNTVDCMQSGVFWGTWDWSTGCATASGPSMRRR